MGTALLVVTACGEAPKPVIANLEQLYVAPFCHPRGSLEFASSLAPLKVELGDFMGVPQECAHTDDKTGDEIQRTSTGLAYYRKASGMPTFTDGKEHWALKDQLIKWTSGTPDPPAPKKAVAAPSVSVVGKPIVAPPAAGTMRAYLYEKWPTAAKRMDCVIYYESHWRSNALNRTSDAAGLAQFIPSTWARTPQGKAGKSPYDPYAAIDAFGWMVVQGGGSWSEWEVVYVGLCPP